MTQHLCISLVLQDCQCNYGNEHQHTCNDGENLVESLLRSLEHGTCWMLESLTHASVLIGSVCWKTLSVRLPKRTANRPQLVQNAAASASTRAGTREAALALLYRLPAEFGKRFNYFSIIQRICAFPRALSLNAFIEHLCYIFIIYNSAFILARAPTASGLPNSLIWSIHLLTLHVIFYLPPCSSVSYYSVKTRTCSFWNSAVYWNGQGTKEWARHTLSESNSEKVEIRCRGNWVLKQNDMGRA